MKKLLFIALTISSLTLNAQVANYFQAGVFHNQFKKNSYWKNSYWPGFNIAAYGVAISFYSGRNAAVNPEALPYEKDYKAGGNFFDIGYTRDVVKWDPFRRIAKRPIIYPTWGIGIGTYKLDDTTGFQINFKPGLKFIPVPGVALVAQLHTGYAAGNRNVKGFYFSPVFGIQFSTNLQQILGDTWLKKSYSSGGWREYEYTKPDGSRWKHTYYQPAGTYVTDYVVHARNVLNFTAKSFVGFAKNSKGTTIGGGPAFSLRWGMFAFDLEYLFGKVGYVENDNKEDSRFQSSWNMRRFGFGMGIDLFGIPRPLQRPSFIRLILGAKIGAQTLKSDLSSYGQAMAAAGTIPAVDVKSKFFWNGMLMFEFGTLGLSFESFNYFTDTHDYSSGFCFGAHYMIPLANVDK